VLATERVGETGEGREGGAEPEAAVEGGSGAKSVDEGGLEVVDAQAFPFEALLLLEQGAHE
jgi:hypothetical protein